MISLAALVREMLRHGALVFFGLLPSALTPRRGWNIGQQSVQSPLGCDGRRFRTPLLTKPPDSVDISEPELRIFGRSPVPKHSRYRSPGRRVSTHNSQVTPRPPDEITDHCARPERRVPLGAGNSVVACVSDRRR